MLLARDSDALAAQAWGRVGWSLQLHKHMPMELSGAPCPDATMSLKETTSEKSNHTLIEPPLQEEECCILDLFNLQHAQHELKIHSSMHTNQNCLTAHQHQAFQD